MRVNVQRVFVGNLPTEVTENDISKRFSKYGTVQSTEIKWRSDGSVFAYVNLEADRSQVNECLENLPKRKWHGQHVKVELARESFLDRLARERQEQQSVKKTDQIFAGVNPTGNFLKTGNQDVEFVQTCIFKNEKQRHTKLNHITKSETEHSDSDDCEVRYNKNLPMFRGIENSFVKAEARIEETQLHSSSGVNPTGNFWKNGNQDDEFVQTCISKSGKQEDTKLNHIITYETEHSGSDDCEVRYNKKLPMFRGTENSFVKVEAKIEETQLQSSSSLKDTSELTQKRIKKKANVECDLFHVSKGNSKYHKSTFNNCSYEHKKQKIQDHRTGTLVVNSERNVPSIRSMQAEEKRLKSIEEKRISFKNQIQTVKRALAVVDATPNKKIIFSDNETSYVHTDEEDHTNNVGENPVDKRSVLFNDESSEDETNDFKIKTQFEGRKGQKLLELQSRYANDKRFTLDERFYESDNDESPVDPEKVVGFADEKKRQLNILHHVLGDRAHVLLEKRGKLGNTKSMLRFDPLKADHKQFEVVIPTVTEEKEGESKKSDVQNDLEMQEKEDKEDEDDKPAKVQVSKEKFYEVTDRLKETLKSKTQNDTQFSLLQMFGSTGDAKGFHLVSTSSLQEKHENSELNKKKQIGWSRNPFRYDSSDSEDEDDVKQSMQPKPKVSENVSEKTKITDSFFFKENDARLKEGIEFITTAKRIGEEEFAKRRRELKLIIKSKIKNNLRKKRPWKKKLGGQRKKHSGKRSRVR